MTITINDSTVKSLKHYLEDFTDDAKIVFTNPEPPYENRELVICCNFEHQNETNTVQLSSGFAIK